MITRPRPDLNGVMTFGGRVTHISVGCRMDGTNQCWNIANWTPKNKLQRTLIEIRSFSLTKVRLKMCSAKCCPFRPTPMS